MAELGVGYISIVPEVSKVNPAIRKALGGADPIAEKSGQSMGGRISSGIGKTLKRSVVGVGVAAGGGLAASLTKGLGRLSGIENAEAKLSGLGHEAGSVANIMDDALVSVKGTSFGLEDAATVAASAVAAGIEPGEALQRTLKLTGDAATIAGIDISSMGSIVNKVATSDMMQMDVANQLMDAGIPILQMVAAEMGVTADEARKLASDGEISFEIFQSALEQGVSGAALKAGDTVQGSFANLGAAAGRLGATLAGPFYDQAAGAFGGVTDLLDGLNDKVGPVMDDFASWFTGTGIPAMQDFASNAVDAFNKLRSSSQVTDLLDRTKGAFTGLFEAGRELGPTLLNIGEALGKASAALGVSGWNLFLTALEGVGAAARVVTPPLEAISKFMADHPALVTTAVAAWTGFKTVPGIVERLSGSITKVRSSTSSAFSSMKDFGGTVREAYGYARQANPEMGRFGTAMTVLAGEGGVASVAMDGFKGAASGVMGLFGGPWGLALAGATTAITTITAANQRAETAQENIAAAARDSKDAHLELAQAVAGTTGELSEEGLAAAARVANNELAAFVETGESYSNWLYKVDTDAAWWERILGTQEWQDAKEAASQTKEMYAAYESVAEELGLTQEDVNEAVGAGGPVFDTLIKALQQSGDSGAEAANELLRVRDSVQQSIERMQQLDPEVASAAETFADLADNTGDAADGADRLRIAFMELRGINMSATESAAELTKELASATGEMEGMAGAALTANGTIDTTTDSGVALYEAMNDLGTAMQRSVGAGNDANEVFDQSSETLEAMRTAAGMGEEEWQGLLDTMGMTPERMEIVAEVLGDQAKMEIAGIAAGLEDFTTGPYVSQIVVQDEDARARLEDMGFRLANYDETTGIADLHVNDQASIDKLNWWIGEGFPSIDFANPTAEANLRVDGMMLSLDYAKMQLETLDLERPNPLASMDISTLNSKQIEALNAVDLLDGQRPNPDANMNISRLTSEQQTALAQVFDLDGQTPTPVAGLNKSGLDAGVNASHQDMDRLQGRRPTPTLDANGQPLRNSVNTAQGDLNSLQDKTVNIYTNHWTRNMGVQSTGGMATGGRFVPRYAEGDRHPGYRLPKAGPGTGVTDGFLAFNHAGAPSARLDAGEWVINGRASDRYDRELAEINAGTFPKLPGYADGGKAHSNEIDSFVRGQTVRGHRASRPLEGSPYVWAGINWGDCSAAMAAIARFAVGLAPFAARFATGNQREALSSMGFISGRGPEGSLRFGWKNGGPGGGHTSGTLPNGVNVEMGGGRGNGQYGGNAASANHPQYTDHAWIPVPSGYQLVSGTGEDAPASNTPVTYLEDLPGRSPDGGAVPPTPVDATGRPTSTRTPRDTTSTSRGTSSTSRSDAPTSWSQVAGIAASEFASGQVSDLLGVFGIPDSPPGLQAYRQWEESQADMRSMAGQVENVEVQEHPAQTQISEAHQTPAGQPPTNLDSSSGNDSPTEVAYDPAGGAEQWRMTARMALEKLGIPLSNLDRTISQIDIESGGDPNAQNNWDSNAAAGDPSVGLLQVIGSTFAAFRAKDLPNDRRHPLANIYAASNYAIDRYDALENIWPTRAGYWAGGWVNGVGNAVADAIPAMVSNGEFVVRASKAAQYGPLLEQINGDRPVAAAPSPSGGEKHYHFHGPDARDLMRQLEAKELASSMQHLGG